MCNASPASPATLPGVNFGRWQNASPTTYSGLMREPNMPAAVTNKTDLFKILSEQGGQLRALGVRRLGLFGSYARGQQRADSDIDLLVEFEPGRKTFDNFMAVSLLLEQSLGRPVELVTLESLSPYIGPRILREVEYVALAA